MDIKTLRAVFVELHRKYSAYGLVIDKEVAFNTRLELIPPFSFAYRKQ